ncbi:sterol desaturase family protein [Paracidovorax cattleyae]|uniref:Sterol desaturase/sphingolipid hydroxylase, fatty acid hydroxylase superfamily n=1 Tax=Paracidovorax cattleyae TaxID=80868 RepID=A0A1H0KZS0_9BURK|nr:sterol desaturase family protein [Paracidovorax cattleyae]SDO61467.1 Sterol desaturase/sphingolipid hydroxylase, fatty acid hydroxylase superfamily [Paracidovorax cattleyae]
MDLLYTILKFAVLTVLVASTAEAAVLSLRAAGPRYDWHASGVSLIDFLVREYPLRWLLPLAFWSQAMDWLYQHRLWTLPMDHWTGWAACFLAQEFCYYGYHRAAHRVRWFWCTHAIHHSPNDLNLSVAYRFGWTGKLTGTLLFFMAAPLLGMPPKVILVMLSLNLLYQFWIHATWIPRLGPLEWILNTPSAHRVHHASNLEYLDGNYGGVLIVFDRLFGTYIAERPDLPCRYGLVRPVTGCNLLKIEFDQWRSLWRDLRGARSVAEALGYLFKPPGWHPCGAGETTEDLRRAALNAPAAPAAGSPEKSRSSPGSTAPPR